MNDLANLFRTMEEYAAAYDVPIIQPEAGKLLASLVTEHKPFHILEIGTAIGYSTLLMADQMPAGGKIITLEVDEERAVQARRFIIEAEVKRDIELLVGDAGKLIPTLTGPFDFVFIDAAKGQYVDYLQKVRNKLSANAVIAADNILFRGWVDNPQNAPRRFRTIVSRLRQYLNLVNTDPSFKTTIYNIGDGLAVTYFQKETFI